jgi:predicted nucleotidyltransferase
MNASFGFNDDIVNQIKAVLARFPSVEKASIFGSRAMGNFKKGSDIDLVLYGNNLQESDRQKIFIQLNEYSSIPYKVDVILYQNAEQALKDHIDSVSKELYIPSKIKPTRAF